MRKAFLFLSLGLLIAGSPFAQRAHHFSDPKFKDVAIAAPKRILESETAPLKHVDRRSSPVKLISEADIGETRWDDQSNASLQNRLYVFEDGTIGATWIMGMTDNAYPDRGTGYNYFDGTGWQPYPGARIEDERCGWPSYAPLGTNGEIVVSHTSASGLKIATRTQKGAGTWNLSLFTGPTNHEDLLWPRMITSGANKETIHILALTPPSGYGGTPYMGLDGALVYSRSTDGGATWIDQNIILPGMGSSDFNGFASDAYAFAEPKGDTLALVVGDNWHDLFLMKSTDGGANWTKTVLFEHPYPFFDETTTLVTDTPWVCDGGMAVALDRNGDAHVVFGLMRVLNDDLTDGETSYFPFTDGLAHWKEGDAAFTSLNIDSVDARGDLVGFMVDWNGNDTLDLLDGGTEIIGLYYLSISGMPSLVFDQSSDEAYLMYASLMENKDNGLQHFRHIMGSYSADGGMSWSEPADMTGSIVHNFDECVYPTLPSKLHKHDVFVRVLYQRDEEPGLSIWGDEDAATDNTITIMEFERATGMNEISGGIEAHLWPNPSDGKINLELDHPGKLHSRISILDVSGRIIRELEKDLLQGETWTIDLSDEAPGLYFFRITAGGKTTGGKFILQ